MIFSTFCCILFMKLTHIQVFFCKLSFWNIVFIQYILRAINILWKWLKMLVVAGKKNGRERVKEISHVSSVSYIKKYLNYSIKNTVKHLYCTMLLWFKITVINVIIFLWCKAKYSSAITSLLGVTWSLRNHSNMVIWIFHNRIINAKNRLIVLWKLTFRKFWMNCRKIIDETCSWKC